MRALKALPDVPVSHKQPITELLVELGWVATSSLVIDTDYQRDVGLAGKAHIQRIAEKFSWAKFAPLIVAPTGDGRFAIIDGQHRATAAKARALSKLPALIIPISPEEQASAFAAINGNVTPISSMHVFKAALAAGEQWARDIEDCAGAAGVRVLRYPKPVNVIGAFETMAVTAIRKGIATHGAAIVTTALKAAMTRPAPGLLNQHVIKMMIALAARYVPAKGEDEFIAAIADINLAEENRNSAAGAAEAGISRAAFLEESIGDRLKEVFRGVAA